MRRAVKGERDPITFGNDGLGYSMIDGALQGRLATYPYYNETTRKTFLREVLLSRDPKHAETAVDRARRQTVELRLEPGRSLLDQTGVTVAGWLFANGIPVAICSLNGKSSFPKNPKWETSSCSSIRLAI